MVNPVHVKEPLKGDEKKKKNRIKHTSTNTNNFPSLKGRTIRKVMGGWGGGERGILFEPQEFFSVIKSLV